MWEAVVLLRLLAVVVALLIINSASAQVGTVLLGHYDYKHM